MDAVVVLRTVDHAKEPFELLDIVVHENAEGQRELSIDRGVFSVERFVESIGTVEMALLVGHAILFV